MKQISTNGLESALSYRFIRRELLDQALTHSSHAREHESSPNDNEQLEFLGDAVLGFVTSQELFTRFPHYKEGELSKLRAHLVSARHLVRIASQLQIGQYLHLGRGEEKTGGRTKSAILVDALEAILAAMYLDGGIDPTRRFILENIVRPELEHLASADEKQLLLADYKSRLQELLHAAGRGEPEYVLVREEGAEHRKTFTVEVRVLNIEGTPGFATQGEGASKKRAGQVAAQHAIQRLEAELGRNKG